MSTTSQRLATPSDKAGPKVMSGFGWKPCESRRELAAQLRRPGTTGAARGSGRGETGTRPRPSCTRTGDTRRGSPWANFMRIGPLRLRLRACEVRWAAGPPPIRAFADRRVAARSASREEGRKGRRRSRSRRSFRSSLPRRRAKVGRVHERAGDLAARRQGTAGSSSPCGTRGARSPLRAPRRCGSHRGRAGRGDQSRGLRSPGHDPLPRQERVFPDRHLLLVFTRSRSARQRSWYALEHAGERVDRRARRRRPRATRSRSRAP